MSNVEEFPSSARRLTEYEALVAAAPTALDAIPGAVYVCDHDGWLVLYNTEAAELWGRAPVLSGGGEQACSVAEWSDEGNDRERDGSVGFAGIAS
jgi:hypothetical protein